MGTAERRHEILKILCRRRHETISNLAFEFGVSERTIRRDIQELSLTEPLYTQTGRYGGGVYIVEGYSMSRMYMSENESEVLHKILKMIKSNHPCNLTKEEVKIFERIVIDYTKPTT